MGLDAEAQLGRISDLLDARRMSEAVAAAEAALADFPDDERVLRAGAIVFRKAGNAHRAEAYLRTVLTKLPDAAWVHIQLGVALQVLLSADCIVHMRRAMELEPGNPDYRLALIGALSKFDLDDNLDEAYRLLKPMLPGAAAWRPNDLHIAYHVLSRVCAFEELAALGSFSELGRKWVASGDHSALLLLLGHLPDPGLRFPETALWNNAVDAGCGPRAEDQPNMGRAPERGVMDY